jgi:hypothetical protein
MTFMLVFPISNINRTFEETWNKTLRNKKYTCKNDPYNGWIAQCELWDINADDLIKVEDSRIPLDRNEVKVQYERFHKYVKNFDKVSKSRGGKKDLALHFPSSIEFDLCTISVLRTVFRRRAPFPKTPSRADQPSTNVWRPIKIPVQHTPEATLLFGLPSMPDSPNQAPQPLMLARTPAFRLLTHCKYVLYQSVEEHGCMTEDEEPAGTIAVYEVTRSNQVDHVKLLGCIEGDDSRGCIVRCVFHPTLPLLAFHYVSALGDSQIYLWFFAKDFSEESRFMMLNHELLQRGLTGGFALVCIASVHGRLQSLHFSSKGEALTYRYHQSPKTHEKSITDTRVYTEAVQAAAGSSYNKAAVSNVIERQPSTLASQKALPSAMTLDQPVLHADGSSTVLSFDHNAAHRDVKLVHSDGGVEEEQSLLSLPDWSDIKYVSVSMRMPDAKRQDKVTFILNKTAQPFYVLGSGAQQTAPTVLKKDVRAIGKKAGRSDQSHARMLSTKWRGISESSIRDSQDDCRRKRLRLDDPGELIDLTCDDPIISDGDPALNRPEEWTEEDQFLLDAFDDLND